MKFYNFLVIAITAFFCSNFANATEPLCHTPGPSGICYFPNSPDCFAPEEKISIAGIISGISPYQNTSENPITSEYYQFYSGSPADTSSRFSHFERIQHYYSQVPPNFDFNSDSVYGIAFQLKHVSFQMDSSSSINPEYSNMLNAFDSNFILITADTPVEIGDSVVINNYSVRLSLECSNANGSGSFDGEYTIYPASTTTSLPNEPNSQNHQTPIRYYTVDGKLQTQKPEFVPVVGVRE